MKIVFVSRLYLPHLGGVEIHLREISAILSRLGHEVCIVTLQHDKKLGLQTEQDDVKIFRIPFEASGKKQQTWRAIKEYRQLFKEADIVHAHDVFWWLLPVYSLVKKKVFITFHGWEATFPIPLHYKIHRFIVSKLSQGTIHVGSFIQKFYWDKPTGITYGGINPKRFTKAYVDAKTKQLKQKSATLKFVFVGRLDFDTDISLYIEFLKELQAKKISFKVVWVGDGDLRERCEAFGEVVGFVKNVSKHIVVADFVFASSYLSILEAQCLEKIVLAFYSNPLKKEYLESFPGSKFMIVAGSVESMFAKIEQLLTSRKLLIQIKQQARQFAFTRTWKKVVSQYVQLWKKKKK